MREEVRDPLRLVHIRDACERLIHSFPEMIVPELDSKSLEYYGVVKNLEIIGEAAYKLTHEFTQSHPATDWRAIIKMRHLMVHGYYKVNPKIVKEIMEEEIIPLYRQIKEYLAEYATE